MFKKGDYLMKTIYYNGEKQWLLKNIKKGKDYHTHISYNNKKAAQMICVKAYKGVIPKNYPVWMVDLINRLWFGKDFMKRKDLNNENLYTNDPDIRIEKTRHTNIFANCFLVKNKL